MFDTIPTPAETLSPRVETLREARLRRLERMGNIGLNVAEKLDWQVDFCAAYARFDGLSDEKKLVYARRIDEIGATFAKVSRAVSVAAAVEDRIDRGVEVFPDPAAQPRRDVKTDPAGAFKRAQLGEAVEQVISADEKAQYPRRQLDLRIRLDRLMAEETQDLDRFLDRPLGEIVARISRDLGLEPDWDLWDNAWSAEAETAEAEAKAATPISPPRQHGCGGGGRTTALSGKSLRSHPGSRVPPPPPSGAPLPQSCASGEERGRAPP
jgi:hypothetical protein